MYTHIHMYMCIYVYSYTYRSMYPADILHSDIIGNAALARGGVHACLAFGDCFWYVQHTATHCNTLQHAATQCNTLQHAATRCNTLPHTATHNTILSTFASFAFRDCLWYVQHTAIHCNKLLHIATRCNTITNFVYVGLSCFWRLSWVCATHYNTLHHAATHCIFGMCNVLQHTATHRTTLQHTATRCSTLQNDIVLCIFAGLHM